MRVVQDGVDVYCCIGYCKADEEKRNPVAIEDCPYGHEVCTGDCYFYDEQ